MYNLWFDWNETYDLPLSRQARKPLHHRCGSFYQAIIIAQFCEWSIGHNKHSTHKSGSTISFFSHTKLIFFLN